MHQILGTVAHVKVMCAKMMNIMWIYVRPFIKISRARLFPLAGHKINVNKAFVSKDSNASKLVGLWASLIVLT